MNVFISWPCRYGEVETHIMTYRNNPSIWFECPKVPSHYGDSFVHPQHMLWLRNKTVNFKHAILSGDLVHLDPESSALSSTARIVFWFH